MFVTLSKYLRDTSKLQDEVITAQKKSALLEGQLRERDNAYYERQAKEAAENNKRYAKSDLYKVREERDEYKTKYIATCNATNTPMF